MMCDPVKHPEARARHEWTSPTVGRVLSETADPEGLAGETILQSGADRETHADRQFAIRQRTMTIAIRHSCAGPQRKLDQI